VVEVDGYEFHKTREQFEKDRRRDAKLQTALDCRVLRVVKRRVENEPSELISDVIVLMPPEALIRPGRRPWCGEAAAGP
jgi:very-short-patch-repair endonuclease